MLMTCFLIFNLYLCYRNMLRLPKIIRSTLSVRIGLMVISATALLLMASMTVMLIYARKAVKEEATQKASVTLDYTTHSIDNILLSVEQTTGNIFFNMLPHLNNPDMMFVYARKLVETNPYVAGCAIAFKEDYYQGHKLFMAYFHHADSAGIAYADTDVEIDDMFGDTPYTEQSWYANPMKTGKVGWTNPLKGMETSEAPIITFCLPIPSPEDNKPIGVIGVDVSLSQLSKIVQEAKPSEHSYCTLIDQDGTFIVHPLKNKLMDKTALMMKGQSVQKVAKAMISGKTGYSPLKIGGQDLYVFYKPFKRAVVPGRSIEELGWSAGIVYPEDDIFGDYNDLLLYVIVIAVVGLVLSTIITYSYLHNKLKPLVMLTEQAQRIAKGDLDEPIPNSNREDEIGRLQDNFKLMQQSLATNIGELEQLKTDLQKHGEELSIAYKQAQKADRMKTVFLHNMTNQMQAPSRAIRKDVEALCNNSQEQQNHVELLEDILKNGNDIADLLRNLLYMSNEEIRKEVDNV